MSEYYFDYQVTLLSDELHTFASEERYPRLFFERDYRKEKAGYVLYITFPQWDARGKSKEPEDDSFDEVEILYDVRGIDTVIFDREDANIEIPSREIKRADYRADGFRCDILTDENDYSGVGRATFKKKGTGATSVLYFAVNFAFKNRIRYSIRGGKLVMEGKDVREGLSLRVNSVSTRYPCLASDRRNNAGMTVTPDFSQKPTWTWQIPDRLRGQQLFLTFDASEQEADKFYLLECVENDTVRPERREFRRPEKQLFCPYCHRKIEAEKPFLTGYEAGGGRTCRGKFITESGGEEGVPTLVHDRTGRLARHLLYCEEDFSENGKLMAGTDVPSGWAFARALPAEFMKHNHFKIVVVGSKRAGKTTFLSRMFDINGTQDNTEMSARMMVNATGHKGFTLAPYAPRDIVIDEKNGWRISENAWFKSEDKGIRFYSDYSIDIAQGRYPTATDKVREGAEDQLRNPARFPFVFEVNAKDYIYFYDIAGEDAEKNEERLAKMMSDGPTGIFYLVDGSKNRMGNDSVFQRICQVLRSHNLHCPIAVVLTKFDKLEEEFDPNSHCLRADAYDMMTSRYEGSALEQNIELASEEIRSYLRNKGDNPDFGPFANVRYFGMSSFADSRAVMHRDQTEGAGAQSEINYLRYASSAKRMELPLIWMLRQFGCII